MSCEWSCHRVPRSTIRSEAPVYRQVEVRSQGSKGQELGVQRVKVTSVSAIFVSLSLYEVCILFAY